MDEIPSAIYGPLRATLLKCGPFGSEASLRAMFIHEKLKPWRGGVPQGGNAEERVDALMEYLYDQRRAESKENALVLFLRVLAERIDPGDECHQQLEALAEALDKGVGSIAPVTNALATAIQNWLDTCHFTRDIAATVDERTRDFTGREWVFTHMGEWLAQGAERVFLLTGEPGTGKTALAARLVQFAGIHGAIPAPVAPEILQPGFIAAAHFCSARSSRSIDPRLVAGALAGQLAAQFPAFKQALFAGASDLGDLSAQEVWNQFLLRPLAALGNTTITILVDSLDESRQHAGTETVADLLARSGDIPQVRWLLTSRPEVEVLDSFSRAQQLDLIRDAPPNVYEVRDYAAQRLATLPPGTLTPVEREDLARRIAAPDLGNFLYARYVLDDLVPRLERGEKPTTIKLPKNLAGVYRELLARIRELEAQYWQNLYQPLLGVLATALGDGLPFSLLQEITSASRQALNKAVLHLQPYLTPCPEEGPYRLYHQSFADFLLDRTANRQHWIDPAEAHRHTAEHLQTAGNRGRTRLERYALRYKPAHLAAALEAGSSTAARPLVALLTDLGYLTARLDLDRGNTWPLEQDLARVSAGSVADEDRPLLHAVTNALRRESHVLREYSAGIYGQLYNRLWRRDGGTVDQRLAASRATPRPSWLRAHHPLPVNNAALQRILSGHTGGVRAVAVTADGQYVVSAGADATVRVWEWASGQERAVLSGHTDGVRAVAVTADGQYVVSAGDDATVRVWEWASGQERAVLSGHTGGVRAVAVTADGQYIVSAGADATVRVWEWASGQERAMLSGHTSWVNAVVVTADGQYVVSAGADATVRVWEWASGQERAVLSGHTSWVNAVVVTADGQYVVSAGDDATVRVWEWASGQERAVLSGHTDGVNAVAVTADGQYVVSAGADATVRVWEWASGQERAVLSGHTGGVRAVAVTADGQYVVSAGDDRSVRVWEWASGQERAVLSGHTGGVRAVAVTADGQYVVSAGDDRSVRVWEWASGQERAMLSGHTGGVNAVVVTADGQYVVSAGADATVRVWEWASGQERAVLSGHTDGVRAVAVTADGQYVVSAGDDRSVRVWEWASGQERAMLSGHTRRVRAVAVTADGQYVVSAGADATVRIWEWASGQERAVLSGHTSWVNAVVVTADGQYVVSAGDDATVRVWEWANGQERTVLSGHTDWVNAVVVTADGQYVVSAGDDRSVRVWNLATGVEITRYYWDFPITSCAVSPHAPIVVVGDSDGHVLFFTLEGLT